MKSLHVGLLIVGAGIAGGLAIKMTQLPPIPVAAPSIQPIQPPAPAIGVTGQPVAPAAAAASRLPKAAVVQKTATAPAPIYSESAKPAIRKNEPIFVAHSKPTPWAKPTQWTPGPYQSAAVPTPVASRPATPIPAVIPVPTPTPVAAARHVTLRLGMTIPIRLDQSLSSENSAAGDTFQATLAEPLAVDGLVIAERGARVTGRIVDARSAGRIDLELSKLDTSDGQRISITTDPWTKQSGGKLDIALGSIGIVLAARGKPVNVPSETVIRFRLASRVTVTEQQIAGR